ncbi:unnamed protein product [Calypogeia fissa]
MARRTDGSCDGVVVGAEEEGVGGFVVLPGSRLSMRKRGVVRDTLGCILKGGASCLCVLTTAVDRNRSDLGPLGIVFTTLLQ